MAMWTCKRRTGRPALSDWEREERRETMRHAVWLVGRGAEKSAQKRRRAVIRSDGQRFESAAAASRALGVSSCMVAKTIRGSNNARTVKGFSFRWEDDDV